MRLIALLAVLSQLPNAGPDAAIAAAKETVVAELDPAQPDIRFEDWLRSMAAPGREIDWEVNDCGEQTGNPELDRGRDFPMCVEARVPLDGNRVLWVSLLVGTWGTGVSGGIPGLRAAYLAESGQPAQTFRNLSEAASAILAP